MYSIGQKQSDCTVSGVYDREEHVLKVYLNLIKEWKDFHLSHRNDPNVNEYFTVVFEEIQKMIPKFAVIKADEPVAVDSHKQALLHIWDYADKRYDLYTNDLPTFR